MAVDCVAPADEAAAMPRGGSLALPWFVWCAIAASTAILIACEWDMSWHRSIGRDAFLSPPHVLLYLGAMFACGSSGYLILRATFATTPALSAASVRMWGFRGPIGAFVTAWGGMAMLCSAPFDNWWHAAYGLDIKVLSPPHVVLIAGSFATMTGAILLASAYRNSRADVQSATGAVVLYAGALALTFALQACIEDTFDHLMHGARFYRVVALVVPGFLVALACASGHRWGATLIASIYSAFVSALILILPAFAAEPKLGPVLHPISSFVPPPFPLLIVLPAAVLDVARSALSRRPPWLVPVAGGTGFLATFAVLQWPFASFLHTTLANNRVFGAHYFAYFQPETSYAYRRLFYPTEASPDEFWLGIALAFAVAILMVRVGLGMGDWLSRVRR